MPLDLQLRWRPLPASINARIESFEAAWLNTPHVAGQRTRLMGVDCVQLGMAFLDTMFGNEQPTFCPRLPVTVAMHSFRDSWPTIRALRNANHGSDVVRTDVLEAGDLVITRSSTGRGGKDHLGHLLIVMPEPLVALAAMPGVGVCRCAIESTRGIVRIFRPRRKDLWASPSSHS